MEDFSNLTILFMKEITAWSLDTWSQVNLFNGSPFTNQANKISAPYPTMKY